MKVGQVNVSTRQVIWSALAGIVIWTAVGFNWFGYGFNWQTRSASDIYTSNILADNLANICVAQARNASNTETAMKEFVDLDHWKRRKFVETERWAVMPGSEEPVKGVIDACVDKLLES